MERNYDATEAKDAKQGQKKRFGRICALLC